MKISLNYLVLANGFHGKESACQCRRRGSVPGLGRSPGEGNGNPLSILEWEIPWIEEPGGLQSMEWQESQTRRSD